MENEKKFQLKKLAATFLALCSKFCGSSFTEFFERIPQIPTQSICQKQASSIGIHFQNETKIELSNSFKLEIFFQNIFPN